MDLTVLNLRRGSLTPCKEAAVMPLTRRCMVFFATYSGLQLAIDTAMDWFLFCFSFILVTALCGGDVGATV